MEKYENRRLKDGRYQGLTYKFVAEKYPTFIHNTYHKDKKIEKEFKEYLKDYLYPDPLKDPFLKDAWYLDPRAKPLIKRMLDPTLLYDDDLDGCVTLDWEDMLDEDEDTSNVKITNTSKEEYLSKLDQTLINQWHGKVNIGVTIEDAMFLFQPEIVNSALALRKKYIENKKADMQYIQSGRPSKVVTDYYVYSREVGMEKNLNSKPTGKWCLFFDKTNENEDGLTDLDIRFQLLLNTIKNLNFSFKVSTRRPSVIATSYRSGVIIVYCSEDDRIEILFQAADILKLQRNKKYFWKMHTSKYSKDGINSSDFQYYLKAS
ncbi:unnamed protein product [Clavelina lepadiformis]|uniref:Uncharacterized protein n=1 Tax=Clavelina lepadiformis TaxID=159417 RepID=A0ABP0GVL1_CLALP